MKYVPSLPPPGTVAATGPEVKALAGIRPSKPVQARTLPPLVVQPQARRETPAREAGEAERRHDPHLDGERRTYCRRIQHLPVLLELRSGVERRRHRQRAGDVAEHVDEKA